MAGVAPALWTSSMMPQELTHRTRDVSGTLAPDSRRAALIVAITCASISLIAASLICWWFALMKRSFRHHLIMILIVSDMGKALWFFVVPLVVLVSGPVTSASSFCQASGFFLAQATEASDFAALMLALHLVACVFRPPKKGFQGGLHNFRRWIYLLWALIPILAASLAFVNDGNGYVSYGAFCYLPQHPVWYRMALAWVPRYVVFVTIFSVAFTITIHVHIKFKRFSHLDGGGLPEHLRSEGSTTEPTVPSSDVSHLPHENGIISRSNAQSPTLAGWQDPLQPGNLNSGPLPHRDTGIKDFAPIPSAVPMGRTIVFDESRNQATEPSMQIARAVSETPSYTTDITDDTGGNCFRAPSSATDSATEELLAHRHSIERHLRILFLYPVSYMLVWIFPFVSQCLQLTGHHFEQQPLWLQILVTGVLALQASVDAAIFSYRERPWKRPRGSPLISVERLRRLKFWRPAPQDPEKEAGVLNGTCQEMTAQNATSVPAKGSPCWWEEEGKKRRDSVWMGTDALSIIKSRQQQDEDVIEDAIEEDDETPSPGRT